MVTHSSTTVLPCSTSPRGLPLSASGTKILSERLHPEEWLNAAVYSVAESNGLVVDIPFIGWSVVLTYTSAEWVSRDVKSITVDGALCIGSFSTLSQTPSELKQLIATSFNCLQLRGR